MTEEKKKEDPLTVYQAISRVQAGLAKEGISKDRKNEQQGYKFRGIDDIYNALASLLAEHGLCILPRVVSRQITERVSVKEVNGQRKETALFYVVVEAEYDFISAHDGSRHTVRVFGEAMDSGDKATNKAMSAAYKYACLQAFSIPTEGDNDADGTTHEVAAKSQQAKENIISSFDRAASIESLQELWGLNANIISDIQGRNTPESKAAYDDIVKAYKAAGAKLKKPSKPNVDEAMAGGGNV